MLRRSLAFAPFFVALAALVWMAGCASDTRKPAPKKADPPVAKVEPAPAPPVPVPPPEKLPRVMLGIDVLEAEGFKAVAGKKLGLLTHRAGDRKSVV